MKASSSSHVVLLGIVMLIGTAAVPADEISSYTIDNGGVTSTDGVFEVTGSIGQADAGELSDGTVVLNGGFWTPLHPFVPVELLSFEVAEGSSPSHSTPAVAADGERDRAGSLSPNLGARAVPIRSTEQCSIHHGKGSTDGSKLDLSED